ncbi:MAG: ribonuclease P protein component [Burkholderiaceae bacterium]
MTAGDLDSSLLGRIVRPADYVRVLATPMRLRSPHFAVHHLDGRPLPLTWAKARSVIVVEDPSASEEARTSVHPPVTASLSTELSTGVADILATDVDDLQVPGPSALVETPTARGGPARWLGLVVPKRHAKRAVTRTLVKRQIRNVAAACAPQLEPGLWVVRQRSPFDPKQYPSAASNALKEAARAELRALFDRAVRGERDRIKPRPPGESSFKAKPGKGAKAKAAAPTPMAPGSAEGSPCVA